MSLSLFSPCELKSARIAHNSILTVDLVSRRQKSDVYKGNPSSVSIIKLHHHAAFLLLLLLTRTSWRADTEVWVSGTEGAGETTELLSAGVPHHGGRSRGKGSESVRSNRHTLGFPPSGWPPSGVAHLTPGSKHTQSFQEANKKAIHKTFFFKNAMFSDSRLLVVAAPASRSLADFPVPLQWRHWIWEKETVIMQERIPNCHLNL